MADIIAPNVSKFPARSQATGTFSVVETYEPTAFAQNDIYYAVRVGPGVSVTGGFVGFDALGANTALEVGLYSDTAGTAVDDDCFVVSGATTSAGITNFNGSISTSWRNDTTADYYIGIKSNDTGSAAGTIRLTVNMTAESTDQT
jgi:hypothetical protein